MVNQNGVHAGEDVIIMKRYSFSFSKTNMIFCGLILIIIPIVNKIFQYDFLFRIMISTGMLLLSIGLSIQKKE
jgi:hypothetical protein